MSSMLTLALWAAAHAQGQIRSVEVKYAQEPVKMVYFSPLQQMSPFKLTAHETCDDGDSFTMNSVGEFVSCTNDSLVDCALLAVNASEIFLPTRSPCCLWPTRRVNLSLS